MASSLLLKILGKETQHVGKNNQLQKELLSLETENKAFCRAPDFLSSKQALKQDNNEAKGETET